MNTLFRAIPPVDTCMDAVMQADPSLRDTPRPVLRELVASFWDNIRQGIREKRCRNAGELSLDHCLGALCTHIHAGLRPNLQRVINATGVVVHTNLGRSVLAKTACDAVQDAASGYCNLEFDLKSGMRGSRHDLVEGLLCKLCGAEAAMVVNNNAAAVLLVLNEFCQGGEVVLSRGELVEIGGSFRIPDVMEKSGVHLREVGTTNRTHLADYESAINESTRALMRVHTSNYRIVGFHSAVSIAELVSLARENSLPLLVDLGSGSLLDFEAYGLPGEPTVQSILADGADLVMFSGDKVLGGPQAGIIAGKHHLVEALKKNPLTRALRCDKLCFAALEATLRLYADSDLARKEIPTLRRICMTAQELEQRAKKLARHLRKKLQGHCRIEVRQGVSRVGGGAFPQYDLPTSLVCLTPAHASACALKEALLATSPPLLGRLELDQFCLDPRTLEDHDFALVARVLAEAFEQTKEKALAGA